MSQIARPRARALALLKESERLEGELLALTTRLVAFTDELQAQLATARKGGEHVQADEQH